MDKYLINKSNYHALLLLDESKKYMIMTGAGDGSKIKKNRLLKSNKSDKSTKSIKLTNPNKTNKTNKIKTGNIAKLARTNNLSNSDEYYTNPIVNFITSATIDEIQKYLYDFLKYAHSDICNKFLSSGLSGAVIINTIGPTYTLHYENINVTIPVVIKEANNANNLMITIIDKDIYIYNDKSINVEAIILYFIRPLIELKLSPHLPLIIEHGKCIHSENQPIDRIITEMHGLQDNVTIDLTGFYESPLWKPLSFNPDKPIITSHLATLGDMCLFFNIKKDKNDDVILPNGITCNVIELLDYLSITYIITYDLLYKHNIYLMDMHPDNVFIHWLNSNSFMRDQYIGDTDYIFYKIGKTYYKIKTFGIILKIGDVGASILHPRKDIYIVGQGINMEMTYPIVKKIITINKCHEFFTEFKNIISTNMYHKTVANNIMNSSPYNELHWSNISQEQFDNMLSPEQLLNTFFSKYTVDKIDEKDRFLQL